MGTNDKTLLNSTRFKKFLLNLGFPEKLISQEFSDDTFTYKITTGQNDFEINYVYTPTEEKIFSAHLSYWNRNNVNAFIAVGDDKTHIINAKEKPDPKLTPRTKIHSFDYGVNTEGFEKHKIQEISKEYIDASYFFDFISKNQKSKQEVDKDLLLNLIALRNDLLNKNNDKVIHLLILRCLFIRYLEDKKIYPEGYLVDILNSQTPNHLIKAFDDITKINGDIFKFEMLTENEIEPAYLQKLGKFFSSDYRTGQLPIFPYRFDKIPIQLISHVYEAFLGSEEKKGKGIYYTPAFVVNFILSHTLKEKLKEKQDVTVLDPAVGSGAFLVESFKMIVNSRNGKIDYDEKKKILQNQLYGIDTDPRALQIATFSLYLALLETENPEFIRKQIEQSHPILPSLIDHNLRHANALTDSVFENIKFDCIVSNPPWGPAKDNKEREAIEDKGKIGTVPEFKNVSGYERSQAFLLRVNKWGNTEDTIFSLLVKNSIFLNDKANDFRKDFLEAHKLTYFYELSNYNKILFKKRAIGKINGKDIEIGATEPCAILVFKFPAQKDSTLKYISPKLNTFSENFQCIHFTQKDIHEIKQSQFLVDDLLWRVLANGSFEDLKLIKEKLIIENGFSFECRSGFKPQKNMVALGEPDLRNLIKPNQFIRYRIIKPQTQFNFNQTMERKREKEVFEGERILFAVRPLKSDDFKMRGIRTNNNNLVYRDDILCVKAKFKKVTFENYKVILGILNSKLIGYLLFHISSQWGKEGEMKRPKLRNIDIEKYIKFPKIQFDEERAREISFNVEKIEAWEKDNGSTEKYENCIDELVFELYGLLEYEKEIIREFYEIKVERVGRRKVVTKFDMLEYIKNFSETFSLMLAENYILTATYKISGNLGAVVCFTIVDKYLSSEMKEDKALEILHFVKKQQMNQVDTSKILNEDKVKIYDGKFFYIIKSNLFKDWTKRQAIKDAKEEVSLLLSNLPENHEA